MSFAVVEFDFDNSVDVVETSQIVGKEDLQCGGTVSVCYKSKNKKGSAESYTGIILSLHGK